MKSLFQYRLVAVLLLIIIGNGVAGDNPAQSGFAFLKLGAGSRSAGMGEAMTAIVADASGTYWNPAGLAQMNGTELHFTHNKWLQGIANEFVAVGFRFGTNALGLSFMSNTITGIERRTQASTEPLATLSTHDILFGLSFARNWGSRVTYGVTLKYLYQKIYIESSNGIAADIGLQYQLPIAGLKAGLALQNWGYVTAMKNEKPRLPQTIRLGLGYFLAVPGGNLIAAMDWVKIVDSSSHLNFGLEYNLMKYLSLRTGYQTGFNDKGMQVGIGLRVERYGLDYAYVPFASDLGNSHRVSVKIGL
ncbi:MAG: PorV/PorQ family protein [candidate division KSB1 bacterium]|nr:PorV/PorQ family protein [candidate division KSB1 bacterium]MDZ7318453.1 PorV/PorQ family protein [candidate division KSB1 bacterium]MDZ7340075.1 PorV/PorQ family protein [candidate division KSB1 bacterium]